MKAISLTQPWAMLVVLTRADGKAEKGFETRSWRWTPRPQAAAMSLAPRYITLGTYRQKNAQLDAWRTMWGLPAPEWEPDFLEGDGTHEHLLRAERARIYSTVIGMIEGAPWQHGAPRFELCKEPHELRQVLNLRSVACNCLQ